MKASSGSGEWPKRKSIREQSESQPERKQPACKVHPAWERRKFREKWDGTEARPSHEMAGSMQQSGSNRVQARISMGADSRLGELTRTTSNSNRHPGNQ